MKKVTTSVIRKMKVQQDKIAMLTAYDYPTAKLADESGIDIILVGDSLGNVVLGYDNTTKVTMEDMIHHTKIVSRAVQRSMVVADMPFLSCHKGITDCVVNAGRLIQEGDAQAVKIEGGEEMENEIKAVIRAGIPVMGHIGLTPQSVLNIGGFFVKGKTVSQAEQLIKDAKALERAGVFGIVLECVPAEIAAIITEAVSVPTIGIGAGPECDGQVLVVHDILGFGKGNPPSFVKVYGDLNAQISKAISSYVSDVKSKNFPEYSHSTHVGEDVAEEARLY